jgi:hypothetical protein
MSVVQIRFCAAGRKLPIHLIGVETETRAQAAHEVPFDLNREGAVAPSGKLRIECGHDVCCILWEQSSSSASKVKSIL